MGFQQKGILKDFLSVVIYKRSEKVYLYIIIIAIAVLFVFIKKNHVKFNWGSMKYKRAKMIDDAFGVYLITGKQGTNKTYYSVQLALNQNPKKIYYIKTNIHSLKIPGFEMRYFSKVSEIYKDTDENVIYIIDEISRKWKKNSPADADFYAWLNQCRKRGRIAILITQEYLEVPMWIRRPCKFMLSSNPIPFLTRFFCWYSLKVGDGYNLQYDKDEGEYICPTIKTIIYKRNRYIASMYDTLEPINDL